MADSKALARLAALYAMMERMRSVEVQVANVAVENVTCSAAIAAAVRASQVSHGREALETGRREAWQVAETTRAALEGRIERLQRVRVECEAALAEAESAHRTTRLDLEQVESILDKTRTQLASRESRRTQAAADDRFASRSAWLQAQRLQDSE